MYFTLTLVFSFILTYLFTYYEHRRYFRLYKKRKTVSKVEYFKCLKSYYKNIIIIIIFLYILK